MFTPLKWGSSNDHLDDEPQDSEENEASSSPSESAYQANQVVNENDIFTYPAPPIPRPFATPGEHAPNDEDELEGASSFGTGSPNQLLAEFFQKKGSEPLSDIEAAGVMSILTRGKNANILEAPSTGSTVHSIHTPSLKRFDQYPSTANMFTPRSANKRLKRSSDHGVNTPKGSPAHSTSPSSSPIYSPLFGSKKKKRPSQSPSFIPRKMSHFSSIPTPYRPTSSSNVYQSVTNKDITSDQESTILDDPSEKEQDIPFSPEKPLSQTASTLLSLIDDQPEELAEIPALEKEKPKSFVNPYASTASRSTPRKNNPAKLVRKSPTTPSSVVQSLERTMPSNGISSPSQSKESNASQKRTIPAYLDKYKPTRSSTLRQSLIPSPASSPDIANTEDHEDSLLLTPIRTDAKRSESSSTTIIDHPKLTPTWAVPDYLDDDEISQSQAISETAPAKSLYPQISKTSVATTPFKFGAVSSSSSVEKTPASKPFTFVSPNTTSTSSDAVNGDTQTDVTKTPKLEHKNLSSQTSSVNFGPTEATENSLFSSVPKLNFGANTLTPPVDQPQETQTKSLYPSLAPLKENISSVPKFSFTNSTPLFGAKPTGNGHVSLPTPNGVKGNSSGDSAKLKEFSATFVFPTATSVSPPTSISGDRLETLKESFSF